MTGRIERIGEATLYLADCRDILPGLPKVDAVVTDPPYGIAKVWKGGGSHGWAKAKASTVKRNSWDDVPPDESILNWILSCPSQIIWGGNYFQLPPSRCWLVWNKPERGFSLADAELAWTNRDACIRVFDHPRSEPDRVHETQKPVELMKWCLGFVPDARTILDPFMGSGTTGVACVKLGRAFIGIEREPEYFEIACRRIAKAYEQPDMIVEAARRAPAVQADLNL